MLCIHCGSFSDTLLCPVCSADLKGQAYAERYTDRCPSCARPIQDRAYPCLFCQKGQQAYAPYTGIVISLLREFKAEGDTKVARVLAPLYIPMLSPFRKPLLLPVPASRKGFSDRGFDHMHLICTYLEKKVGYPSLKLFGQKGEGQSKFLSRKEREGRHSIVLLSRGKEVSKFAQQGYTFVLLDDITTTGSTLATCSSLLSAQYGIDACALVIAMV